MAKFGGCYGKNIEVNGRTIQFFAITRLIFSVFLIFCVALAGAVESEEWGEVIAAYNQATLKGDFDTIDAALRNSSRFAEKNPRDGRAMTYHGSLLAMKARE